MLYPSPLTTDADCCAISDLLRHYARTCPDRTALEFKSQSMSYAGLDAEASALAGRLQEFGVDHGARVVFLGRNHRLRAASGVRMRRIFGFDQRVFQARRSRRGISHGTEALAALIARFRCEFAQGYGMTEVGGSCIFLEPSDHEPHADRRLLSIGRPGATADLDIRDSTGQHLAPGEIGGICIKSIGLMTGYWRRPDEEAAVLRGSWYRSGDAGYRDADGYYFLTDRFKDMIVTGGGGDFGYIRQAMESSALFWDAIPVAKRLITTMLDSPKPIIGKINGHAIGLSATLALFCDVTFAAEHAKIADPHVAIGLSAGDGGAVIWPQLIGYNRAKEFLFTGEALSAPEAARLGLINHAVAAAELDQRVQEYAMKVAAMPHRAV